MSKWYYLQFNYIYSIHYNIHNSKDIFSPNHLMLGSTLATVPGATVDWYCKGLTTFPRLLLWTKDLFNFLNTSLTFHCNSKLNQ